MIATLPAPSTNQPLQGQDDLFCLPLRNQAQKSATTAARLQLKK